MTFIKTQKEKTTKVLRLLYDRITCPTKARKTGVSAAGVRIVWEIASYGATYHSVVDFTEVNVKYDKKEAPWRRCVKIKTLDLTNGRLFSWTINL